jgi:hypothetical protein
MHDAVTNCDAPESDRRQAERKRALTAGLLVAAVVHLFWTVLFAISAPATRKLRTSKNRPIPNEA